MATRSQTFSSILVHVYQCSSAKPRLIPIHFHLLTLATKVRLDSGLPPDKPIEETHHLHKLEFEPNPRIQLNDTDLE